MSSQIAETPRKTWERFDEESKDKTETDVAVLAAEVEINRSVSGPSSLPPEHAVVDIELPQAANGTANNSVIRQGFVNGDIIVTLLPTNTRFPWITPAQFRPELVPEELMAQGLTLTVEDYVNIMELLTNDYRFTMYNICYKRVLVVWIFSAFSVLLGLLFSGLTGLLLFGLGVLWLVLNAAAIFLCMWVKYKKKLQDVIQREEAAGRILNSEETQEDKRKREQFASRMDIEDNDYIIQGSQTTRISRKQERANLLLLRYSSRWVKLLVKRKLDLGDIYGREPALGPPRHCNLVACPCQYIEAHLKYKPREPCFGGIFISEAYGRHFVGVSV